MSYGDEREEEKILSRIFSAPPTAHPSLFYFSITPPLDAASCPTLALSLNIQVNIQYGHENKTNSVNLGVFDSRRDYFLVILIPVEMIHNQPANK
ncbi:hypothetical protein OUZ56_013858 [Daphnia magna]|uniref:Uncharacterized protein n=1 Tax=Daphnia magna TaxID=35525 RepID=A0ABQ9Z893_9CRUS|nr:hypothetical protein OUZ56_013858 [Daphnia magna]